MGQCAGRPSRAARTAAETVDDGVSDDSTDDGPETMEAETGLGAELSSPELMESMAKQPRRLFKTQLKNKLKAVDSTKRDGGRGQKDALDLQFLVLAKVYSEEDPREELGKITRLYPRTLLQMLPFLLNALLYTSLTETTEFVPESKSLFRGRKKPNGHTGLHVIDNLTENESQKWLEQVVYEQCMRSVDIALYCSWYFMCSLTVGPQSMYHRTMKQLLSIETAIVINRADFGEMFRLSKLQDVSATDPMGDTEADAMIDSAPPAARADDMAGENAIRAVPPDANPSFTDGTNPTASTDVSLARAQGPNSPDRVAFQSQKNLYVNIDSNNDGRRNVQLQMPTVEKNDREKVTVWLEKRQERATFFHAQLDFVKCLTDISYKLFDVERSERRDALRTELENMNNYLPKHAFIPTEQTAHRVLSIVYSEAKVFSTKERAPYMVSFEVEKLGRADNVDYSARRSTRRRKRSGQVPDIFLAEESKNLSSYPEERFAYRAPSAMAGGVGGGRGDASTKPYDDKDVDIERSEEVNSPAPVEPPVKSGDFGELWSEKAQRLRSSSKHGHLPNWALVSCIVKARDQLRQEMFAMHLITDIARIFEKSKLKMLLKPYQILATSGDSGFIETIPNSASLSSLRENPNFTTLDAFFRNTFGGVNSGRHRRALDNFVRSMAGYSVLSYVLAIKDRHNGNLMLDSDGRIVHIDFGFLLSNSPGGNFEFEKAPFKLTQEMVSTMGGPRSKSFRRYRKLCCRGYAVLCRQLNRLLIEVDLLYNGNENMPCFVGGRKVVLGGLRERMMPKASSAERMHKFDALINQSMNNWTTRWYDRYQKCFTGIS